MSGRVNEALAACPPQSIRVLLVGLQDRNIGMAPGREYRFARFTNKQKKAREAHATDSCMHPRRPRSAPGDPPSTLAENSKEGRADQVCRLRRARNRSAHPQPPLA